MVMGRPKGSTNRPALRDKLTPERITRLVNKAFDLADKGDPIMLKFLLEQIYGKAVQPLGNDDGKALLISFDGSFVTSAPKEHKP